MAYQDLYSDAALFYKLDGSFTYSTTGTSQPNIGGTGTPIYVNDSPLGIEATQSLKLTNYPSAGFLPRHSFNNFPVTGSGGSTFTCWVKLVPVGNPAVGSNLGTALRLYDNRGNGSAAQTFGALTMGIYSTAGFGFNTERNLQIVTSEVTVSTQSGGLVTTRVDRKFAFNTWYHIAITQKEYTGNIIEKAVYVNGECWDYDIQTNKGFQGYGNWAGSSSSLYTASIFGSYGTEVVDKYISHYAWFTKALTKDEIRAQAWYGKTNQDYTSVVLADSPTYLAQFDNATKAVDHSVYGATAWGPLNDTPAGFTVNEQGPANLKAWTNTLSTLQADNASTNTDPDMMSGLTSLITSGEYSIEFWFKNSQKVTQVREFLSTDSSTSNLPNGYFQFRMNTDGNLWMTHSYKSGTSTYITGSNNGVLISVPTTGQEALNMNPGTGTNNFADNQWHHAVYSFSKSDAWYGTAGQFVGNLYVDGCKIGTRTWTNTYGWLDGTTPQSFLKLGIIGNLASFGAGGISLAALAFYPRRLSETEIDKHFIAGKVYVTTAPRTVKYYDGTTWQTSSGQKVWNGTAWVDWTANRFDGTSWVSI